jgi:hypothetical protein
MNTKEKLRVEIKKRLNQLERQCTDMTSLLSGLGINVGGSLRPSPNEASCVYLLLFNIISLSTSLHILDSV